MSGSLFAFLPSVLFMTRTPAAPHAGDVLSVMPFLSLAREVAALLLPLRPRQDFRDDLERSLMSAARQQNARGVLARYEPALMISDDRENSERRWVIAGAAVGSAVSIAGIVAYVLMRRERAA
jgi:hypothetical protein